MGSVADEKCEDESLESFESDIAIYTFAKDHQLRGGRRQQQQLTYMALHPIPLQ